MDRPDLDLMVVLSEAGSLTAAARRLHVVQPALSRRLDRLEREVGAKLFERGRRGAVPTPVGRVLAAEAGEILRRWDQAERAVAAAAAGRFGRLRLGVTPTLGTDLLPPVLGRLRSEVPEVEIDLLASGDSSALRRQVADGGLDAAVVVLGTSVDPTLRVARAGLQPIALVLPADHRLARRRAVPRRELVGVPLVALRSGEGLRQLLDEVFAELEAEPVVSIETTEREMLLPFVAAGLGLTLLPEEFARQRIGRSLVARPLAPTLRRRVGIVVRPGPVPLIVRNLLDAVDAEGVLSGSRHPDPAG